MSRKNFLNVAYNTSVVIGNLLVLDKETVTNNRELRETVQSVD